MRVPTWEHRRERFHRYTALLVALVVAVRLAALLVLPDALAADPDSYRRFAHTLRTHGTYGPNPDQPSAYRPPLYPLLLVPCPHAAGGCRWYVAALHLAAAGATGAVLLALARRCGGTPAVVVAGLVYAFDPVSVQAATLVMTETVFTFLLLALLALWLRPDEHAGVPGGTPGARRGAWFGSPGPLDHALPAVGARHPFRTAATGVVLGLAALARPTAWSAWLLLGVVDVAAGRRRRWLAATALALAVCLPWGVRNVAHFDRPILTTTHGGYTLWLGQNPTYYRDVVAGPHAVWPEASFARWTAANGRATAGMDEVARDRHFRAQALAWMRANPRHALHGLAHHVGRLWSPLPNNVPPLVRTACCAFYVVVYALALTELCQRRWWRAPWLGVPATLLAFTLVHAVYWSDIRMRAPLMPLVALLAGAGAARLLCMKARSASEGFAAL